MFYSQHYVLCFLLQSLICKWYDNTVTIILNSIRKHLYFYCVREHDLENVSC